MEKLIIEARVNELAVRDENPNVPYLPKEIISDAKACYDAGASILHYHGRNSDGTPNHSPEFYLEVNSGIRELCPILLHPSLGYVAKDADAKERFSGIDEMMKNSNTKPDLVPMDMGSVNVDWWDPIQNRYTTTDLIYKNSTATLMYFAERIIKYNLKQYLVTWNVSFTRQIDAFIKMGIIPEPAFICICMTDKINLSGHPGTPEGLTANLQFFPKDRNIVWTAVNYKGNLFRLTEMVIKMGGHISIGLGDYSYTEYGILHNSEIIHMVAKQGRKFGREPASVSDVKRIIGISENGI
jgi:uncharacterized protein (DUF849 family)